ncbi:VOC family protein [Psychrobacillus sp. NEAU-3TGS]|uniref:VOC family protein n=1 Tax=Psychrobacillus sp. NEAU-3TGS TaxID=2995412 RepID=UPI00249826E9|nr:VOC family protein [Psychrobacillus sp. NEAU-3TGS]MDI2588488.1 VOC family protein [Psychrobacillus sp. NEAU-3TGS]
MGENLLRVGTIYIPITNVKSASEWYVNKLGAELSYKDEDKAILNLANQSFFLVKSNENQSSNFVDMNGEERFSMTFEVNGLSALENIHKDFIDKQIQVGEIENRGHAGRNFVFYDLAGNKFDVWSELSPIFKEKYLT